MATRASEGGKEFDGERDPRQRVGQCQTHASECVVHRLIAAANLLPRRVIYGHRQIGQLVPEIGGDLEIHLHPLRPTRRAYLERLGRLPAACNRVPALRADEPVGHRAGRGASFHAAHTRRFQSAALRRRRERHRPQLRAHGDRGRSERRGDDVQLVHTGDHVFGAHGNDGAAGILLPDIDISTRRARGGAVGLVEANRRLLALRIGKRDGCSQRGIVL